MRWPLCRLWCACQRSCAVGAADAQAAAPAACIPPACSPVWVLTPPALLHLPRLQPRGGAAALVRLVAGRGRWAGRGAVLRPHRRVTAHRLLAGGLQQVLLVCSSRCCFASCQSCRRLMHTLGVVRSVGTNSSRQLQGLRGVNPLVCAEVEHPSRRLHCACPPDPVRSHVHVPNPCRSITMCRPCRSAPPSTR